MALLAWVLVTQVQWHDRVVLTDGSTWVGHVVRVTDAQVQLAPGGWLEDRPGAPQPPRLLPLQRVETRSYGDQRVPDVSYGARTLTGRLASRLPAVVPVLLGLALLVVLTGLRWTLLLRGIDIRVPALRCVRLTFVGGFFNIAVPGSTGGDFVKAWYAHREARARYPQARGVGTRAVLSVFVDRFVGLFGLVVLAAGVLLVSARGAAYDVPRTVVLGVLAAGAAGGVLVLSRRIRHALGLSWLVRRMPFQRAIEELRAAARLYARRAGTLAAALGISLFNHAGNAVACWLLAGALGLGGVSLAVALALVPLANLLSAIPLLPGGWGVGELAFAYFFGLVGVPATEAVGLSVVFRLAVLGVNLPGGLLWIVWKGHPSRERIAADVEAAQASAPGIRPQETS